MLLSVFSELVERVEVFLVQLDGLQVGLDSRWRDGLGEDNDSAGDTIRDKGGGWGDVVLFGNLDQGGLF